MRAMLFATLSLGLLLFLCSSAVWSAPYTMILTDEQEIALAYDTEQINLRAGIVYATSASVTNGSTTVMLKAAANAWIGRWLKVIGDTAYYKITAAVSGVSVTVLPAYAGASGGGKDVTIHPDNGGIPISAAIPDTTKVEVLQMAANAHLSNVLRNLDVGILPILSNLKVLDTATRTLVIATEPSPAKRIRAQALAAP